MYNGGNERMDELRWIYTFGDKRESIEGRIFVIGEDREMTIQCESFIHEVIFALP
jgi:hypothetical protein